MLKIDRDLLVRVGLGEMSSEMANVALKAFYQLLELRVGTVFAERMTNAELDEFEEYFEAEDDDGAFQWLCLHFPDYKEIVRTAYDQLEVEIAGESETLMEGLDALLIEFNQQPTV
jgi:hypothetical protein